MVQCLLRISSFCCLVLLTSLPLNGWQINEQKNRDTESRPNFVWLISEDNSKHFLKHFDPSGAATPNLSALAKNGLTFQHAFSNAPVCSVARTTLLTGCYPGRIGTQFHRRSKLVPMPEGLKPFPAYLREAGYYTTNRRKTDYNVIAGKQVWDESSRKASWRNRKKGQSFFHKQSFATSHEGSLHFSKKVMKEQKTNTNPQKVFIPPIHPDTEVFRYTYARYHDRIQQVDREIGKVIQQLKTDGLLDSTFIFYFGDHGGVLPGSKGYAYETGLHVPLIVHVPQKFASLVKGDGRSVSGFVSFVDFGPTLLNLAGLEIPKGFDGKPFLGKNTKISKRKKRDETFGYADRFDEKYDFVRTYRKGRYKYIRNYQPFNFDGLQNNYRYKMLAFQEWRTLFEGGKLNSIQSRFFRTRDAEELYDIENDPYETKNLAAADPQYAAIAQKMRLRLNQHLKSTHDLSFYPESYLFEQAFKAPARWGKDHAEQIAALADIADLSLVSFEAAKAKIENALKSKDPWERYWALIVCTTFKNQAAIFKDLAAEMAENDSNRLVRIRAAEFLAIAFKVDPNPVFQKALDECRSGVEVGLILNSLVMLRDGEHSFEFKISKKNWSTDVLNDANVKRRLLYLTEID